MASEHVERLRRGYEAYDEGGPEAIYELLVPDIVVSDRASSPDRAVYQGLEGLRQLFEQTMEAFAEMELEPEEYIEEGNKVAVVLRQRVKGRGSGMVLEDHIAHVWEFNSDGRAIGMQVYASREKALAAMKPA
jgi:ketosteroid isomerase-like protein